MGSLEAAGQRGLALELPSLMQAALTVAVWQQGPRDGYGQPLASSINPVFQGDSVPQG